AEVIVPLRPRCHPLRCTRPCSESANRGRHHMTPKEFVTVLDEWSANGGIFSEGVSHDYVITTAEEANAVCRALSTGHMCAIDGSKLPTLHRLLAFFQSVKTKEAGNAFRDRGLPLLRKVLTDALDGPRAADTEDRAAEESERTHLFLV